MGIKSTHWITCFHVIWQQQMIRKELNYSEQVVSTLGVMHTYIMAIALVPSMNTILTNVKIASKQLYVLTNTTNSSVICGCEETWDKVREVIDFETNSGVIYSSMKCFSRAWRHFLKAVGSFLKLFNALCSVISRSISPRAFAFKLKTMMTLLSLKCLSYLVTVHRTCIYLTKLNLCFPIKKWNGSHNFMWSMSYPFTFLLHTRI